MIVINKHIYLIVIFYLIYSAVLAGNRVESEQQACSLAIEYIGKEYVSQNADKGNMIVQYEALNDTTTPFISKFIGKEDVWRVIVKDVLISKNISRDFATLELFRDFEVFLDPKTGRLLKLECFYGDQSYVNQYTIRAKDAEEQINNKGHGERYNSIPDDIPIISFVDALLGCGMDFYQAEQIHGQYIMHQVCYGIGPNKIDTATPPAPVWIISLVGVPTRPAKGGDISYLPEYTRNRYRQIINAVNGKLKMSTTKPQVKMTQEDIERIYFNKNKKKK